MKNSVYRNSEQAACPIAISRITIINKATQPAKHFIFRATFLPLPELQFSSNILYQKDIFQTKNFHDCHNISANTLEILI